MVNKAQQSKSSSGQQFIEDKRKRANAAAAERARAYRARKKLRDELQKPSTGYVSSNAEIKSEIDATDKVTGIPILESYQVLPIDNTQKQTDSCVPDEGLQPKWVSKTAKDYRGCKKLISEQKRAASSKSSKQYRDRKKPSKIQHDNHLEADNVAPRISIPIAVQVPLSPLGEEKELSSEDSVKKIWKNVHYQHREKYEKIPIESSDHCSPSEVKCDAYWKSFESPEAYSFNENPNSNAQSSVDSKTSNEFKIDSKVGAEMLLLLEQKIQNKMKRNDDESFFDSLLPYMNIMDMKQKMLCRMEIQRTVFSFAYPDSNGLNS